MRLEQWLPMYHDICGEFGYDEEADARSAETLSSILSDRTVPTIGQLRKSCPDTVVVCGDGPSLRQELLRGLPEGFVVAADGATTPLMRSGLRPDAIVTDMDGRVEDQLEASAEGSLVFVHAHGDNLEAVTRVVPMFEGSVVGTCQGPPVGRLLNLGGFTDGDRAACIYSGLGTSKIALVGFDFDDPSPKESRDRGVKARKLRWARKILSSLSEQGIEIAGL